MDKRKFVLYASALLLAASSCTTHYRLAGVERSRILIDSRYDAAPDAKAVAFIAPYKHKVDSVMSPVVGRAAEYLYSHRPESNLSNLLADILVWGGKQFNEQPDFAVYNMGGIRSSIAKGDITYGDVLDTAPFENKICFLTLTGDKVLELFRQIASVGGEAVSHGVELVITRNGQLKSARLNGKEIDPTARYRVATLDYLSQGNDKMEAFKAGTDMVSPQNKHNNVRFIIMDYMRGQMSAGHDIDPKIEGRIKVED